MSELANLDDLKSLSLDDLAHRFDDIEQQGQLLQGRILLEARNRFASNKEFGQWCSVHSICVDSQQHRTRLINLAKFFEGRELDKIGISAAYEISAPINADIAVEIYELARGRNLPLAEVRKQIAIRKSETLPLPVQKPAENVRIIPTEKPVITGKPVKTREDVILEDVLEGLTDGEKRHVLNNCLKRLSLYPK